MQLGFHFGFKKSKAYGLCGVMLAILFLGMSGHSARLKQMKCYHQLTHLQL